MLQFQFVGLLLWYIGCAELVIAQMVIQVNSWFILHYLFILYYELLMYNGWFILIFKFVCLFFFLFSFFLSHTNNEYCYLIFNFWHTMYLANSSVIPLKKGNFHILILLPKSKKKKKWVVRLMFLSLEIKVNQIFIF